MELVALISSGKGTWGQVSGLIKYGEWEKIGQTYFRLHNYMLGFHPAIFRTSLVPLLVEKVIKPRERQIMEHFEKSGLKAVQMKKSCFLTTYPIRHKNWLH